MVLSYPGMLVAVLGIVGLFFVEIRIYRCLAGMLVCSRSVFRVVAVLVVAVFFVVLALVEPVLATIVGVAVLAAVVCCTVAVVAAC